MLPLAQPGLLTAFIFNLIFLWKEFFWGLVMLRTQTGFTLGVALNALREGLPSARTGSVSSRRSSSSRDRP